jgi:uncharacterized damage-inducible protein DinB
MTNNPDPRYPIGKFEPKESYTADDVKQSIDRIAALPARMEAALKDLSEAQLDTPYRDGGWTLRQVAHHVADSHMNAYIRVKWTLTENTPLIKAYEEKAWAETPETKGSPVLSINLLKALHTKWVVLLRALTPELLQRQFTHPDTKKQVPLDRLIAMYAWHGEHHLGHILGLKEKMKWL